MKGHCFSSVKFDIEKVVIEWIERSQVVERAVLGIGNQFPALVKIYGFRNVEWLEGTPVGRVTGREG